MEQIKIPSKEDIVDYYFEQNHTQKECCKHFNIKSPITFHKWLTHYGLKGKNVNKINSLENKLDVSEEELKKEISDMYYRKHMSINKIAEHFGATHTIISRRMDKFGIKKYPVDVAKKKFESGNLAPNWKGGRKVSKKGYVMLYRPNYPYSMPNGYVYEHRYVMEKHLGRSLKHDEVVHHKNFNKHDNRLSNLMLLTNAEHAKLHAKLKREKKGRD